MRTGWLALGKDRAQLWPLRLRKRCIALIHGHRAARLMADGPPPGLCGMPSDGSLRSDASARSPSSSPRRLVNATDIVEMEWKGKRFNISLKKKEALKAAEPVYQVRPPPLQIGSRTSAGTCDRLPLTAACTHPQCCPRR